MASAATEETPHDSALQSALDDDRECLFYNKYVASEKHKERVAKLPEKLTIAREEWSKHVQWGGRAHVSAAHYIFTLLLTRELMPCTHVYILALLFIDVPLSRPLST